MPYFTVHTHCEEQMPCGRAAGSEEQALLGLSTIKQQVVEAVCWEKVENSLSRSSVLCSSINVPLGVPYHNLSAKLS